LSSRDEKIRDFIREVAEDFNVEPPEIVVSSEQTEKECRPEACGCYHHKAGRILLREDCLDLDSVLHEFAHHYQYLMAGKDYKKAFREMEKSHCERPHEAEAKAFSHAYYYFYIRRWGKIVP
jgi:hypothetical protein